MYQLAESDSSNVLNLSLKGINQKNFRSLIEKRDIVQERRLLLEFNQFVKEHDTNNGCFDGTRKNHRKTIEILSY